MNNEIVGYVSERGDTYCPTCASMATSWHLMVDAVPVYAGRPECYSCDDCGDHLPRTGLLECAV